MLLDRIICFRDYLSPTPSPLKISFNLFIFIKFSEVELHIEILVILKKKNEILRSFLCVEKIFIKQVECTRTTSKTRKITKIIKSE